jgi:hypothetical protein
MDADVAALAGAMDDLATFLAEHSEPHWADWVARDAARVRKGDGYGVTHFLMAFGGMGSLNDVHFHPLNGNARDHREARTLNARLDALRGPAWVLANKLRHDAEPPTRRMTLIDAE